MSEYIADEVLVCIREEPGQTTEQTNDDRRQLDDG